MDSIKCWQEEQGIVRKIVTGKLRQIKHLNSVDEARFTNGTLGLTYYCQPLKHTTVIFPTKDYILNN